RLLSHPLNVLQPPTRQLRWHHSGRPLWPLICSSSSQALLPRVSRLSIEGPCARVPVSPNETCRTQAIALPTDVRARTKTSHTIIEGKRFKSLSPKWRARKDSNL